MPNSAEGKLFEELVQSQSLTANPEPVQATEAPLEAIPDTPPSEQSPIDDPAADATLEESTGDEVTDPVERPLFTEEDGWGETITPSSTPQAYDPNDQYASRIKEEFGMEDISAEKIYDKLKEISNKQPEKDPLLENPVVQAVLDCFRNNEIDKLSQIIDSTNYEGMSPEQLHRIKIKKDFPDTTDEELEDAVMEFNNLSPVTRKYQAKTILSEFKAERDNKLKQFADQRLQQQEKIKAIREQAVSEVSTLAQSFVGKKYKGLPITADKAARAEKYLISEFNFHRKGDGSIDTKELFDFAIWKHYGKEIVEANQRSAEVQGKQKILNDLHQPSANSGTTGRPVEPVKTEEERVKELIQRQLSQRGHV